jgi:membrane fusion protein (multidrug efflux system)
MRRSAQAARLLPVLLQLPLLLVACNKEEVDAAPPPPPEVIVSQVVQRDVPIYMEALGQTRGSNEVEIRARVEGFLETVEFREGSLVEKGQLLYTIDPRPLQAVLARAQAAKAEAEANLARARQDVSRYEPLVEKNAISREEYETAVAIEHAAVAGLDAAIAEVESANLDLGFCRVESPISGMVGKSEVHPGTLIRRVQATMMTQVSTLDPIHVRVTISEREYLEFARKVAAAGQPEGRGEFELILADGSTHEQAGKLVFVDRAVDPRTGTILIEVSFPNPGGLVRPGQYARVRVATETKPGALLVPQRAVQETQGLYNVAIVGAGDKIEMRTVHPAERVGDLWRIEYGLAPGERIVVDGLQKVRPGIVVAPRAATSAPEATPEAKDETGDQPGTKGSDGSGSAVKEG